MKKIFLIFVITLTFINFISAYNLGNTLEQAVQGVQDASRILIAPFLGGESGILFEKILLFIIIVSLIKVTLSKTELFGSDPKILMIIAFAVSLLATRFLSDRQIIENILLPYSILGVALSAIVPLIIFFIFTQSFESSIIRKISWIFFVIIFLGLWKMRYPELGNLAWIYLITGILAFFFLLFDGTIRRAIINQEMKQLGHQNKEKFETDIRRQIIQTKEDLDKNVISLHQYRKMIRRLQRKLKAIRKN